jgi:hypothetical protein
MIAVPFGVATLLWLMRDMVKRWLFKISQRRLIMRSREAREAAS